MIKILHLDTAADLRGGQRQLLALARGLRERGHQQLIACPPGSRLGEMARHDGFEVCAVHFRGMNSLTSVFHLRRLMRGFNVVHAHDGRGQTFSWLASSGLAAARVASRRVTFLPKGRFIHRLKYGRGCDGVIAVSEHIGGLLRRSGIRNVHVIPDGIDFPAGLPDAEARGQARERFGIAATDFAIGHAGAFTPEKGQDVLIQAFQLVVQRLPRARLLLAGEGGLKQPLAAKYGLNDARSRIRLTGYLDDLSPLLSALDIFVMPSLAEGLGSAALMAMAHGMPVIASRTGGLPEVVDDAVTGWLAEPGSATELAEKIAAAASRPEALRQMGRQAREKARGFTNDIMAAKTEKFYLELIGHG